MAAAASSDIVPAAPTTLLAALSSQAAAASGLLASTEYGCPESDFLTLESQCFQTSNIPGCIATAITGTDASFTVDYNAACCTSISIWGESIASCFEKSAPSCLDTSALLSSATAPGGSYATVTGADATETNPCAPYWNGGKGAGPVQTPGPSSKGATATAGSVATGTATGTSSGSSTAATKASAATKTGAGLKVYLGLGLVGALAVLTM